VRALLPPPHALTTVPIPMMLMCCNASRRFNVCFRRAIVLLWCGLNL
jgi:hypothetical protein